MQTRDEKGILDIFNVKTQIFNETFTSKPLRNKLSEEVGSVHFKMKNNGFPSPDNIPVKIIKRRYM